MKHQMRITFTSLLALLLIPILFQNCGPGFQLDDALSLNLNGKGNGGNGGGYDGKPGTYVLADLAQECGAETNSQKVRAKQIIVVAEDGSMSRTVKDCKQLAVPETISANNIVAKSKAISAFVTDGRFFQQLNLDAELKVPRNLIAEVFCTWTKPNLKQAEILMRPKAEVVDEGGEVPGSSGGPELSAPSVSSMNLDALLFEEPVSGETASSTLFQAVDNSPVAPSSDPPPDPYVDGLPRIYDSTSGQAVDVSVSAVFYPNRIADGSNVEINGQVQAGSRCWMTY